MGKVILPYKEPIYSTYHSLSNAGIPAKQNETSDNWYYNNTVDWRCTRKFLRGFTSPEMKISCDDISDVPILYRIGMNTRFARRCAVDIVKTMIDDGFYVAFIGVDDYYIKGKSWYQEQHVNHDGLIIGYDDENGTLSIAAYNQRWVFSVFETPQECFAEGVNSLCNMGIYGELCAVKVKDDPQELNVQIIYNDLKKYLSSGISDYPLDNPDVVWGIVVYDYLCMYLDKLADGSVPYERKDRRVFRLVWEHKKCMLDRIKAIEKLYGWNNECSSIYEEVVEVADKVRFIYSKFVIKYSNKLLEKIQVLLMRMKKLEVHILGRFLNDLENKVNAERYGVYESCLRISNKFSFGTLPDA